MLSIGLASGADLTVFDEPSLGLDAVMRERFYDLLLTEKQQHPRRTQRPGGVQLVRVKEDFFLDARRRRTAAKAVRGDAIRHTAAKFG